MAERTNMNFTSRVMSDPEVTARLARLRTLAGVSATDRSLADALDDDDPDYADDDEGTPDQGGQTVAPMTAALRREFFRVAERGDEVYMIAFLEAGYDPNMKRARWGDTVLHIAASRNACDLARVLIESGKCDYLLRDARGQLASEKAYLYGRNPALSRLLAIKERKQAEAAGIRLTWRRQPDP